MTFSFAPRFTSTNSQPLTLDQIERFAPSAMAINAHSSRSDRYTYLPTVEVIRGMERAGFMPFKATQSRCRDEGRRDFTKHMIRFRHLDIARPFNVGDLIPEVVLVNSHDGTSAYKLMAGIFRLVCSNGLIVSESMQASISVAHKGDVVGQVIEASMQIAEQSQRSLSTIGDWSRLQLTSGEQSAFAEAAHALRFADSEGQTTTPITPVQLLQPRRSADAGDDLWRTLNRVQENAIRGGLRAVQRDANGRRRRLVTTRPIAGIDQDVRLNRALWTLAERMAELKVSQPVAA